MKKIISPITGKSKYLLIENCEVISDVKISKDLKESLKLSAGKNGTLIVKNLPGTILNRENQNGRIYSTQVLAQAIQEAKPLLETKQLLSQADEHPEGSFVAPSHASHVVTNAYIKRNVNVTVDGEPGNYDMLFMDIEVLNTEEGRNLRALLEAECSIGTSIRGVGDMEGKYVKNYEILGIDFVGNPSSSTFTRMPVSESVQVEIKDPRNLQETFTVTTSSTNVVRDLEQAAVLQQQLEGIGYGTVTKTSTKLDQETDPKTGAQTSIATLETETSDDVTDLDQALQMAKNAMLNGTVNVDSVTIENIQEEDETKESVEETEYVPEETTLNEEPVEEDKQVKLQDIGFFKGGKFNPVFTADKKGRLHSVKNKNEEAITEAKKEDEEDPNLGKKFVLHTDRGFVTYDKNAIDFTDKPEEALHFREGKEENGMVSMSKVTEILDAMGIFDVQKYFQKTSTNLGGEEQKEGLGGAIAGGAAGLVAGTFMGMPATGLGLGKDMGSEMQDGNFPPKGDDTLVDNAEQEEAPMNEENGSNTKYRATVTINDANGTQTEQVPVSSVELDSAQKEIANLWDMKQRSLSGEGSVDIMLVDTITGQEMHFNPESKLLESALTEDNPIQVNNNKVTTELDDENAIEKEFDSPLQAKVAVDAVAQGKADPKVLVPEAEEDMDEKLYSNPSEPSDAFEKEPLEDAANDLFFTLTDIDWDVEKILNQIDDGEEGIQDVFRALPDAWTIKVNENDLFNAADSSNQIKGYVLNAANKQSPFGMKSIKNAVISKITDGNEEIYNANNPMSDM